MSTGAPCIIHLLLRSIIPPRTRAHTGGESTCCQSLLGRQWCGCRMGLQEVRKLQGRRKARSSMYPARDVQGMFLHFSQISGWMRRAISPAPSEWPLFPTHWAASCIWKSPPLWVLPQKVTHYPTVLFVTPIVGMRASTAVTIHDVNGIRSFKHNLRCECHLATLGINPGWAVGMTRLQEIILQQQPQQTDSFLKRRQWHFSVYSMDIKFKTKTLPK